jgi:hypothetical protein
MKILATALAFLVAACVAGPYPSEEQTESDVVVKQLLDYKVGTWNCAASYITRTESRTINHTATGTYTITKLSDGHLVGAYREVPNAFASGDFDDAWVVTGEPAGPKGASFRATYNATFGGNATGPQGTTPTSSLVTEGFVQPGVNASILGFDQYQGHLTFRDSNEPIGWLGSDFGFRSGTSSKISRQWSVEVPIGSNSFSPYLSLSCTRI